MVVDCRTVAEKSIKAAGNISTDGQEVLGRMVRSRGDRERSAPVRPPSAPPEPAAAPSGPPLEDQELLDGGGPGPGPVRCSALGLVLGSSSPRVLRTRSAALGLVLVLGSSGPRALLGSAACLCLQFQLQVLDVACSTSWASRDRCCELPGLVSPAPPPLACSGWALTPPPVRPPEEGGRLPGHAQSLHLHPGQQRPARPPRPPGEAPAGGGMTPDP